ncbi:efflux RND transporter periplasmic adaptor subunit [Hymenobacter sp. 15J16-1T3B]|uniref:efflux RND transporter periplasmic adaptor subunit n=1 Tax=Hymenobacter sp. 15J16-1T3B TaxID=2886941 RepID=UPI001D126B07|nr:efflux RND transporter periplasmic adaptor subunit [Hymenobacter sp. 15J16-1T3B]MCC3160467.1 efflux RND transporter periplasmic adaptor subunit [Hymenobacter sp. 15J16-1T3B]
MLRPALLLLTASAALLTASSCGSKETQAAAAPPTAEASADTELIPVQTVPLAAQPLTEAIRASGKLSSATELRLGFKVGGIVTELGPREGDEVRRGQVLARVNPAEVGAQVTQAREALAQAERSLQRSQNLYRDSVATLEQVQNARTAVAAGRAAVQAAEFNQQYATIVAPVSGRVLSRRAEPGELVAAGAPVYELSSSDAAWVLRVGLADRDVVRVRLGDAATIHLDAYPELDFRGRVSRLAQTSDPASGTYEAEITVQPAGRKLVSGLVGEVDITPRAGAAVATVPVEALVSADGSRGYVYTLRGRGPQVQQHPVRVLRLLGGQVAIASELPLGTPIISQGAAYLTPSSRVTVQ